VSPSYGRTSWPASAREKITARHACKGPQPQGVGQASNQVIVVGQEDAGPPDRADRSRERHPTRVRRFTSHARSEEPASTLPASPRPAKEKTYRRFSPSSTRRSVVGCHCYPGSDHLSGLKPRARARVAGQNDTCTLVSWLGFVNLGRSPTGRNGSPFGMSDWGRFQVVRHWLCHRLEANRTQMVLGTVVRCGWRQSMAVFCDRSASRVLC
jgi:hypothetical protein